MSLGSTVYTVHVVIDECVSDHPIHFTLNTCEAFGTSEAKKNSKNLESRALIAKVKDVVTHVHASPVSKVWRLTFHRPPAYFSVLCVCVARSF